MMKSESIKELATALAKAQSEITGAVKNAENPHYKSKFANLEAVWDVIREPLSKNGLSIIQTTEIVDDKVTLISSILHSSGEWISGSYPVRAVKTDPQGLGSAMSYARRYALTALVGVYQVDDDANAASGLSEGPSKTAKSQAAVYYPPNPKDYVIPFGEKGRKLGNYSKDELKTVLSRLEAFMDDSKNKVTPEQEETAKNIRLILGDDLPF